MKSAMPWTFLTAALLFWTSLSWACQICIPFPTKSLADHLLESSCVVLARENPDRPFTLHPIRVLSGNQDPPELELFLDSQTRRVLSANPDKTVICGFQPEADPPTWRRIGLDHGDLLPLVKEILIQSDTWTNQPASRPLFFAPYLRHPDSQVATLAHLEIGRAPYSQIRNVAKAVPVQEVRNYLNNFRYAEWHALYILFLGQSSEPSDHERIIEAVESHARFSITLQSAAWATAFIEIRQTEALDRLDELYLSNSSRTPDEIQAIHAAYSVQGSNSKDSLQDRIVESYGKLLPLYPTLAPRITEDLTKWGRPDLKEPIVRLLKEASPAYSPEETLQLRAYLRMVESDIAATQEASSKWLYLWLAVSLILLPYGLRIIRIKSK